jgi:prophage tail gpP-like protein
VTAVEVRVGGTRLSSFQRGTLNFSMSELTASFDIEYAVTSREEKERALFVGDAVSVYVGSALALSGYVDSTDDEDSANGLRLRASGRSKSADLADCSGVKKTYANQKVSVLAREIAKPFGIGVEVLGNEGAAIARFSVQIGESAGDAIVRAGALRGLHPYAVRDKLVLATAREAGEAVILTRGTAPLMRTARADSWFERYSHYIFKGQVPSSDAAWGKNAAQLKSLVVDTTIKRYRPLLVQVATTGPGDLKTRAEVIRNQRAGQGQRVVASVAGLVAPNGQLWEPNMRVHVVNPVLAVNDTLLVSSVRMRFGEAVGDETELELMLPSAFETGQVRELKSHAKVKWTKP